MTNEELKALDPKPAISTTEGWLAVVVSLGSILTVLIDKGIFREGTTWYTIAIIAGAVITTVTHHIKRSNMKIEADRNKTAVMIAKEIGGGRKAEMLRENP